MSVAETAWRNTMHVYPYSMLWIMMTDQRNSAAKYSTLSYCSPVLIKLTPAHKAARSTGKLQHTMTDSPPLQQTLQHRQLSARGFVTETVQCPLTAETVCRGSQQGAATLCRQCTVLTTT